MSVIKQSIKSSEKNTNIAEKQHHERAEVDFGGVYYVGSGVPHVHAQIELVQYFEKTTRRMYGHIDLNKEQTVALRDHLSELINHEDWNK